MAPTTIHLAVLGRTGAGKSSFIAKASGKDVKVGDGADSCTQNVQPYEMTLEGKSIILYDTPGFDDSDGNDAQIFETIAQYLAGSLASKKLLNGAIFMQPINDARVPESERVRTELFKRIVGEDAYDHVVIASSMWDKTLKTFGERNERNRINDYDIWGEMLEGDARLMSFLNDYQSAKQIVRHFLYTPPVTMLLQKEIRDKKGVLSETSAGRWLEDAVGARVRDVEQKMMRFGATDKLIWSMEKLKGALSRLGKLIITGAGPAVVTSAKVGMILLQLGVYQIM